MDWFANMINTIDGCGQVVNEKQLVLNTCQVFPCRVWSNANSERGAVLVIDSSVSVVLRGLDDVAEGQAPVKGEAQGDQIFVDRKRLIEKWHDYKCEVLFIVSIVSWKVLINNNVIKEKVKYLRKEYTTFNYINMN